MTKDTQSTKTKDKCRSGLGHYKESYKPSVSLQEKDDRQTTSKSDQIISISIHQHDRSFLNNTQHLQKQKLQIAFQKFFLND